MSGGGQNLAVEEHEAGWLGLVAQRVLAPRAWGPFLGAQVSGCHTAQKNGGCPRPAG